GPDHLALAVLELRDPGLFRILGLRFFLRARGRRIAELVEQSLQRAVRHCIVSCSNRKAQRPRERPGCCWADCCAMRRLKSATNLSLTKAASIFSIGKSPIFEATPPREVMSQIVTCTV